MQGACAQLSGRKFYGICSTAYVGVCMGRFTGPAIYGSPRVPYTPLVIQAGTMAVQEAQMILGVEQNAPWGDVVKVRGVRRGMAAAGAHMLGRSTLMM